MDGWGVKWLDQSDGSSWAAGRARVSPSLQRPAVVG